MRTTKQPSLTLKPGKDGCGGHAWECQTAKTKVSECVCACDGKNHGKRLIENKGFIPDMAAGFIPGLFYNNDTCIDCGGRLGDWKNDSPGGLNWWYRECTSCEYAWAEWKLVARGFKPHGS